MSTALLALQVAIPTPGGAPLGIAGSPPASLDDRGVFVVSIAGRNIGTETFEIRSSRDQVVADAEIQLRVEQDGKTYAFKTFPKLVLNSQLQPQTYSWSQKGAQSSSLEVDFRSSPVKTQYLTVAGEKDNRDFELLKDVAVIDNNVFHHFQLIVDRYRMTKGGKQTFPAFVPQDAAPGQLTIEDAGMEQTQIRGHKENLDHLVVTTELAQIDLWVDDQQHLQRVSIPAAKLEAIRKP